MKTERQDLLDPLKRIDIIKNQVRSFAFEPVLLKEADWLVKWAKAESRSVSKFRAISLAIEIYSEFGYSNKSKPTIERFKTEIENILKEVTPNTFEGFSVEQIDDYKALLEQVCWVYAGAAITHYWYYENNEGLEWIRKANDVIEQHLIKDHNGIARHCSGIRARLSYYQALLYLQLNDAKKAEDVLETSLHFANARLSRIAEEHEKEDDYWQTPDGLRESRYTNICVAKIQGFVKARIHMVRGQLKESVFLLESAEVVLRQSQSPTMVQMIRLWLYKVKRARAGREVEQLKIIIAELTRCYEVFSGTSKNAKPAHQNLFYASVAAFEVALASLYQAQGLRHKNLEESDEWKDALRTARFFLDNVRIQDEQWPSSTDFTEYWEFLKALLESRIEREEKDYEKAKATAKRALALARSINRSDLIAEAYIGIGEALIKLEQPTEALHRFIDAERENNSDAKKSLAKIKAVCCLRKAEAYVELNQKHEAMRMLEEWKVLENQIEPKVIHFIADKVKLKLDGVIGDFKISRETTDLKLEGHSKRLEEWLTFLILSNQKKKTKKDRPDPKWLTEDMGISLSKAYKLIKQVEPDWKLKKSPPTAASDKSSAEANSRTNDEEDI